jgi:hypothetical protein
MTERWSGIRWRWTVLQGGSLCVVRGQVADSLPMRVAEAHRPTAEILPQDLALTLLTIVYNAVPSSEDLRFSNPSFAGSAPNRVVNDFAVESGESESPAARSRETDGSPR